MSTYSINQDIAADILFINLLECKTEPLFDPNKFRHVVFLVPYCNTIAQLRHAAKRLRAHYGIDKFKILDIDITYPIHLMLKLGFNQTTPSLPIIIEYGSSQNLTLKPVQE